MDILSALKTEASKLQQQLETQPSKPWAAGTTRVVATVVGESVISRRPQRLGWQGAKGAVGEGQSSEEECLATFWFPLSFRDPKLLDHSKPCQRQASEQSRGR